MGLEIDKLNKKKKSPVSAWMPVFGLILAICSGILAYAVSPWAMEWLTDRSYRFPPPFLTEQQAQWVVILFIFTVFLMVSWVAVAIFAPKNKAAVTDKDLKDSRAEVFAERKRQKKRQRKMREAALEDSRKKGGSSL